MPQPTTVRTNVWYCHNCAKGPLNYTIDAYCAYCYHQRCHSCTIKQITTRAGR
ncbi:hypothetical protein CORC01_01385 [Colletotrichum orchidophilum]|uniref:RanBP2-type domain-containing protein n=1 Tax=Colletotrichum orchidophilum TaxID=1209926 RepID=A0A1G4BPE1_9PEZI|nr:uncharacterized protein CORC01_01385 [Colletotrichum orchidophilum]OHF03332.1 hypothetical protein CORC01_01385 [Colletotrichum orchidophilum]